MVASRGRNRSENKPRKQRDLDRSSLGGAALLALRRLEYLEDGREKAARVLEAEFRKRSGDPFADVSAEDIERWFATGIPSSILGDVVKLAFVFTDVGALVARHDETAEKRRVRREKLAYTGLLDASELEPGDDPKMAARASVVEETRAAARLKKLGDELAAAAQKIGQKKRSPVSLLADELSVPRRTVERWLSDGRVRGSGLTKVWRYERLEKAGKAEDAREAAIFKKLMSEGRKPLVIRKQGERYWNAKKAEWVTPPPTVTQAPLVPIFRASEGYYGGDATSGYRWALPVREFLSPAVLARMVQLALNVPLDKYRRNVRRKLPEWAVYAVVSVLYSRQGERGHPVKARSGSGRAYGDNTRNDLALKFPEHGSRFVVKDAYSSGNQPTLKTAVSEFEKRMWSEIRAADRTFVHGVVVWTFRRRSTDELASIVERRHVEQKQRRNRKKRLTKEKAGKKIRSRGKQARAEFEQRQADKRKGES